MSNFVTFLNEFCVCWRCGAGVEDSLNCHSRFREQQLIPSFSAVRLEIQLFERFGNKLARITNLK